MSFMLPDVDLTGKVVGNQGKILLQNMGISAGGVSSNPAFLGTPATIYVHNDSGCGLGITCKDSQQSFNVPAGAWIPIPIGPGESALQYIVKYILPNPPVSLLMLTWYAPGEEIPSANTLGNSPVGIGGTVNTSSVQTLSNEGNPPATLVVDVGDNNFAQLFTLLADGSGIWKLDVATVLHTALQFLTNNGTTTLKVGQVNDFVQVLSTIIATGGVNVNKIRDNTNGNLAMDLSAGTGQVDVQNNLNMIAGNINTAGNVNFNNPITVTSGSTSGTATSIEPFQGTYFKVLMIVESNFRNGGSAINLSLPTAFANKAFFLASDIAGLNLTLLGVIQTTIVQDITSLATNGGTSGADTKLNAYSLGGITGPFDGIQYTGSNASSHNGVLLIIGS